jgi:putative tricarboxylic transport membrane protein
VDLKRLKVVVFSGYNQAMTAVLGGHATVVSGSAGAIAPFQANGQARTLAFASPQRLGGIYAGIPTTGEAGYRFTANNWRLVMAPKGLDAAEVGYWDDVFRRLAASPEWKQELETNYLSNDYLDSATTRKYLAGQYGEVKLILNDLGLVKAAK